MEPMAGDLPQLRCQLQIVVGADGTDVAEISGQMRQSRLHIHALGIPALEGVDGKTVAQVVQPWGMPAAIQQVGAEA